MLFLIRAPTRQLLKKVSPFFVLYATIGAFIIFQYKHSNTFGQAYEPRGIDMLSALAKQDAGFNPALAYPLSILTQCLLFFKYLLLWILPNPAWMSVDMFEPFAKKLLSWPHFIGLLGFVCYPVAALWLLLQRDRRGLLGFAMLCPWSMYATELSSVRIQESFVLYRSYLWMPCIVAAMPLVFQKIPAKRATVILLILALAMILATWDRLKTFSSPLLIWNDAARLIKDKDARPGVERREILRHSAGAF